MTSSSKHLVDPELLELLESFPPLELTTELLPLVRSMAPPVELHSALSDEVEMTTCRVPGPAGAPEVGVTLYVPHDRKKPLPCVFHIHGGGFVAGSAARMEPAHRYLAAAADCIVVAVDYRLAPETRFPGAIEDCYAALAWLNAEAASLGVDPMRIGVMGESAGGGLAAALALLARDRGEFQLAFQHLIYPMLDDRTCVAADPSPFAGEFLWTPGNNAFGWTSMLGVPPGADGVSAYAAPARATDLGNLPPAFISTGALDLFLEEDMDYARRLLRQGIPVEFHIYPGAYHAFDIAPGAAVAKQAQRDSLAALKRALAPAR